MVNHRDDDEPGVQLLLLVRKFTSTVTACECVLCQHSTLNLKLMDHCCWLLWNCRLLSDLFEETMDSAITPHDDDDHSGMYVCSIFEFFLWGSWSICCFTLPIERHLWLELFLNRILDMVSSPKPSISRRRTTSSSSTSSGGTSMSSELCLLPTKKQSRKIPDVSDN